MIDRTGDSDLAATAVHELDLRVYRLSAIKKAVYRFSAEFNVTIEMVSNSTARVTLRPRSHAGLSGQDPNDFPNEALDQELRELVAEETKGTRDLLLAQTFSGMSLVDPVGESADFHDDPLGVADCNASSRPDEAR